MAYNKEYYRKYWEKNRDKILEYKRAWNAKNKDKVVSYWKKEIKEHPERRKETRLRFYQKNRQSILDKIRLRNYGIDGDTFREINKKQSGKCPICKRILDKNPSVDHSHITGKIRGLICSDCNFAIGNAGDSPERLRAMADYLEENNE